MKNGSKYNLKVTSVCPEPLLGKNVRKTVVESLKSVSKKDVLKYLSDTLDVAIQGGKPYRPDPEYIRKQFRECGIELPKSELNSMTNRYQTAYDTYDTVCDSVDRLKKGSSFMTTYEPFDMNIVIDCI